MHRAGSLGERYHRDIAARIEKLQEPPPAKMKKALPAPDDKPKKRRGGRRCDAAVTRDVDAVPNRADRKRC